MGKQHSDSGDYTYPSSIRFVPSSHHTYGDAAALLDNAIEPTALQSAAAAHQAAQDRRLDRLEEAVAFLGVAIHRLLNPGEVLP